MADPAATVRPDARWHDALAAVGAVRGDADAAFGALVARHATPGRHYHDLDHTTTVVDTVLDLHQDGDDWAIAVLGAWFHDAVYEPTAPPGANEGRSAVFAVEVLGGLGAAAVAVGAVARLVCLTAGHVPAPGDRVGALLLDADLAVLGADDARYDAYVAAVRREYDHVDDAAWRDGRRRVLRGFLDRRSIFTTAAGVERFESAARGNISRELAGLR